jgi:FAD/FMN-containing dehydrogenase
MSPHPPLHGPFRSDVRARAAYSEGAGIYRIMPRAVAVPADVDDLCRLVRWAKLHRAPLTARGAGSALTGANVGEGIVVDLTAMQPRLLEIDPARRTALTSANVTVAELNQAAQTRGLRMPSEPSSANWATLGGMVATNAAGARTVRYGSVRPWVRGLEIVTADGEVGWIRRGESAGQPTEALQRFRREAEPAIRAASGLIRERFPKVRKNASGFALDAFLESGDVVDLFIGAEGTLGFVTTVEWALDPIAATHAALRVALDDLGALGEAVPALLRLDPSAVELLDRTFLDLVAGARGRSALPGVPPSAEAILLVEFERTESAAVRGAVTDAVRAMKPFASDILTALSPEEEEQIWTLRHAASPILAGLSERRRSMQIIEDGCVPVARLGEYVAAIRRLAQERGLEVVIFGHAGDANIHVNLLTDLERPDWQVQITELFDEVSREVLRLGGVPSGEHGDGRLRAGLLQRLYGAEILDLFLILRRAFDPSGLLNPGIITAPDGPPVSRLKVGPEAVPLPADIAAGLREIERSGGYSRNRLELADG